MHSFTNHPVNYQMRHSSAFLGFIKGCGLAFLKHWAPFTCQLLILVLIQLEVRYIKNSSKLCLGYILTPCHCPSPITWPVPGSRARRCPAVCLHLPSDSQNLCSVESVCPCARHTQLWFYVMRTVRYCKSQLLLGVS